MILFLFDKIDGKLEGPRKPIYWKNKENRSWLGFKDVEGLVINGSGVLNPHGEAWWKSVSLSKRPTVSHSQHNPFSISFTFLYESTQMNLFVYEQVLTFINNFSSDNQGRVILK